MLPVCDRMHFDQPGLTACPSTVSRKFRHGKTCMRILILHDTAPGNDLTLYHIFRIGNRIFIDSLTLYKFHRMLPQSAGNRKLVKAKRRCRRLETSRDLDCRIDANTDGYRQIPSQFLRPFRHCPDMSGAGLQKNRQFIL